MGTVRVAVDVMGGDHAPGEIIRGALAAVRAREELQVFLVGQEEPVQELLRREEYPAERVAMVPSAEVITFEDDPVLAIRRKKQSSMVLALELARSGQAEAVVSAGNTGALMTGGVFFMGRLTGISRPALLILMPTFTGEPVLLLDVGANMDASPQQLLQYAFMGQIYAREVLGLTEPRVALLNIGAEQNKGNQQVRQAYTLFEEHLPGFSGNIEGTELFFHTADVVVCDGFVGNVLLKITEGLSRCILNILREEALSKPRFRLGAALFRPALHRLRNRMDASEYGGALLAGVRGVCIKCHGSSRARAIEQALLHQALPMVRRNLQALFSMAVTEIPAMTKGANHNF